MWRLRGVLLVSLTQSTLICRTYARQIGVSSSSIRMCFPPWKWKVLNDCFALGNGELTTVNHLSCLNISVVEVSMLVSQAWVTNAWLKHLWRRSDILLELEDRFYCAVVRWVLLYGWKISTLCAKDVRRSGVLTIDVCVALLVLSGMTSWATCRLEIIYVIQVQRMFYHRKWSLVDFVG